MLFVVYHKMAMVKNSPYSIDLTSMNFLFSIVKQFLALAPKIVAVKILLVNFKRITRDNGFTQVFHDCPK